jgi:hypothetical protein
MLEYEGEGVEASDLGRQLGAVQVVAPTGDLATIINLKHPDGMDADVLVVHGEPIKSLNEDRLSHGGKVQELRTEVTESGCLLQ